PQHDGEDHAERLRPVGQGGVVQVVRTSPDVEEDDRPEVYDRQAVGVDRTLGRLGREVVHHAEEAGRQQEADCVMAVPPLGQRILHAGKERVALGTEEGDRHRQVVDDVQHGDGDDEGKIEPVRDVDVRFFALQDRAEEDEEIGQPDNGQPNVDVPFGLRIFAALGDAKQVARGRHDDEELVAPEYEPGEIAAKETGAAGALDYIEGGGDERVAAEGEDDR